jgi:quinolinate synthase
MAYMSLMSFFSASVNIGASFSTAIADSGFYGDKQKGSLREVRDLADAVCSTEKMIAYCRTNSARRFIIVTESGIIHRMQKECPDKEFLCAPVFDATRLPTDNCRCSECKYMKLNTLEKLRDCMVKLPPRVELDQGILRRARLPIERMLEISARPG